MLGSLRKDADHLRAAEAVAAWTRERFSLPPDAPVLATEVACALPGCPPLETVVAFWTADGTRHHFRVFKPVQAVLPDDLPFAWMKDALAVAEGVQGDCC